MSPALHRRRLLTLGVLAVSIAAGFPRRSLGAVRKQTHVPDTAWKPRLGFYGSGLGLQGLAGNTAAYNRLAKFDAIVTQGLAAGGANITNYLTALNGIRAARVALGLPKQRIGPYTNFMEVFARKILSMTRSGATLTVVLDRQNQASAPGGTIRIFNSEEPLYNFATAGAMTITGVENTNPDARVVTVNLSSATGPGAAGANVSNSKAFCLGSSVGAWHTDKTTKVAATPGWLIPDYAATPAGDWGVWGGAYGTVATNIFPWAPRDSNGQRYVEWYVNRVGLDFLDALYDGGNGVNMVFIDNFFHTPGTVFGADDNVTGGWGDFLGVGSNQNSNANTAEGRAVRSGWREGCKFGAQVFKQRYPGILTFGNSVEGITYVHATANNDEYRGWQDMNMQEVTWPAYSTTAANYATLRSKHDIVRANIAHPSGMQFEVKISGAISDAQLIKALAFYSLFGVDTSEAHLFSVSPDIHFDSAAQTKWADGTTPWPAVLDVAWGEPTEAPPTSPGGGGNGTNNNGAAIWHRAFEHVIFAANPSASSASFYPPIGLWRNYTGGGSIGLGGISIPADTAVLLIPA